MILDLERKAADVTQPLHGWGRDKATNASFTPLNFARRFLRMAALPQQIILMFRSYEILN